MCYAGELTGLRAPTDSDIEVFETELLTDVETRIRATGRPWLPVAPGLPGSGGPGYGFALAARYGRSRVRRRVREQGLSLRKGLVDDATTALLEACGDAVVTGAATGTGPRVAVGPEPAPWAAEAIRRGGGKVVALDDNPMGLVWTTGRAMDALRSALATRPNISWVQLPSAGVERAFQAGVVDPRRRWTSAKGAFSQPVAEHALALTLAGLRQLKIRACARSWGQPAGESLFGQPVTVVGAGGIATELMRLLEPFGTPVTIVRRQAEPVPGAARTLSTDRLTEALAGARAVILVVALTPETRNLIGRAELAAMEPYAWLVNVARGGVVDTEALTDALQKGQIGGAALDVTDPEPLPAGHPLWDLPNCLITPHTADTEEMTQPLLADRIADNVRRLAAGQELIGRIDPASGY
jgi:phosphoglycerate dehydrogenase-like enzyme